MAFHTLNPEAPSGTGYSRTARDCYNGISNLTLSAWIKTGVESSQYQAIAGQGYLADNHTGFGLYLQSSTAYFQTRSTTVNTNIVLRANAPFQIDGAWHHLAGVRDGIFTRLYLDGERVAEEEGELPTLASVGRAFCLGARESSGGMGYFFNGAIAEVRLWDHARGEQAIKRERFYRLKGDEPGLVGYWPCEEGYDLRAYDRTGYGNHGTLIVPVGWEYTVDFIRERPPMGTLIRIQ